MRRSTRLRHANSVSAAPQPEGCAPSVRPLCSALFGLTAVAQPFEHAFAGPKLFGSNASSLALHLRPARRPVLKRRSLIQIQDECQKAAYHKHDRD